MRRHSSIATLLTLLLFNLWQSTVGAASSKDDTPQEAKACTASNPANSKFYDLTEITVPPLVGHKKVHKDDRDESWHARGYDYGSNFTINFCAPVIETLNDVEGIKESMTKNISAFYKVGSKTYSIGQTSTEPIFRGRKLVLNYTDGSPCGSSSSSSLLSRSKHDSKDEDDEDDDHPSKKKPSKPDPRRKSTLISFQCEHDSLAPKAHISFIGASPDECAYFFEVKSMAACGGAPAPTQGAGPWGVFAVIGIIAAAAYVCGGVAYNRIVMHQRGWRQLPNYSLWAGIWVFVADIFIILTSSCARFFPQRRGYSHLGSGGRGRRDDEANGLIDSYDEEY